MKCKKCHQQFSKEEEKEIIAAMEDGNTPEMVCDSCFSMMENEHPDYYSSYSDADSGL